MHHDSSWLVQLKFISMDALNICPIIDWLLFKFHEIYLKQGVRPIHRVDDDSFKLKIENRVLPNFKDVSFYIIFPKVWRLDKRRTKSWRKLDAMYGEIY